MCVRVGGIHTERNSRGVKVRGRRWPVRIKVVSKSEVLANSQRLKVSEVNCYWPRDFLKI